MGQLVQLDDFRSAKRQVAVPSPEIMCAAADFKMVEWMHRISEMLMKRIADTNKPLDPPVRAIVMEAVAVLRGQPTQ